MRSGLILLFSLFLLGGCTWETYQDAKGQTRLRQKYAPNTRVVYQDGTYSQNLRYNSLRPEPHTMIPQVGDSNEKLPANTNWPASNSLHNNAD